jgi:hypothetical protein
MIIVGIDPGKNGAFVCLEKTQDGISVLSQVLIRDVISRTWEPRLVAEAMRGLSLQRPDRIALELSAGRPGEGGGSARETGIGWGVIYACSCLVWSSAEVLVVSAQKWHKFLGDVQGDDPKSRAIAYVTSRLPDLDLTPGRTRVPHTGLADGGCLALYACARRGEEK